MGLKKKKPLHQEDVAGGLNIRKLKRRLHFAVH